MKRLLYALWDAGFEVGHGTRTVKESVRLADDDVEVHTSLLDARILAGDESLAAELADAVDALTRRRGASFASRLAERTLERHAALGDVPFLLEPNIKDGAGGLRDAHVAAWLARYFPAVPPPVNGSVAGATELIHRIRNWLHDHNERRTDVLVLAQQDEAAAALGYEGDRPGDALMRDYYAAARAIWWHAQSALAAATGGVVPAPDVAPFASGEWTPEARTAFLRVLRGGAARELEALDQAGAIARMLPGWDEIRSLPQRNVYHRYTVDVHCFESAATLAALERAAGSDRLAAEVWADVADKDRALLAALFHDAGKGAGDDHSVRGEALARRWVLDIGLGPDAADEVAWLVRNHLLLAETATRRDTGDERLVETVAAQCRTPERLRMLYVLTVADARATGPEAWTPWKAALVAELFDKALRVLERGEVVGAAHDELIARRVADVRRAFPDREPGEVDAHLLGMTRAYVLAFPASALARHVSLTTPKPGEDEVRMVATPAGDPGVWEVTFAARDRPGLFATVSGALAVSGLNILAAQAFTRADATALEVFRVVGAHDRAFDDRRWARIRDAAASAIRGELDLAAEIAERRRAYAKPSKGKREPTRIVVDNTASDFATVVEVHATDRVGLLYDITHALQELGLDIQIARVATYGDDVVDAFYVRDLLGQRVIGDDAVERLRRDLLARIDRDPMTT